MKRNITKNSIYKPINKVLSVSLLLSLALLLYYNISISIDLHLLKEDTIPSINISIENLKDDILVEKNKNVILIRNTIRDNAEKFGMNKISNKNRINSDLYR